VNDVKNGVEGARAPGDFNARGDLAVQDGGFFQYLTTEQFVVLLVVALIAGAVAGLADTWKNHHVRAARKRETDA
jgi:hypothetical protein